MEFSKDIPSNYSMTGNDKGYNVLIVGNNPKELAGFYINLISFEKMNFFTDVSFDLTESLAVALKNRPNYILLDDCYPAKQLKKFISRIRNNNRTQHIPVGILKTSNKSQILVNGIQDFFLKDSFSAERLFYAIRNSRKIRRAQIILYKTYKRSRRHYQNLSDKLRDLIDSIW
jgi:DNA-binding response OmpR family regulator